MTSGLNMAVVNGSDLTEYRVKATRLERASDVMGATFKASVAADRYGQILLSATPSTDVRKLLLVATVSADDAATLETTVLRRLKGFLSRGKKEIRHGHDLTSAWYGYLTNGPVRVFNPQMLADTAEIQFEFTIFDPQLQEVMGRAIEVLGTPIAIPIGGEIITGVLKIFGPATTSLTVIVRRADGKTAMLVPLTASTALTSAQVLRLDNPDGSIALITSGGTPDEVAGLAYLGDTHDFPFVIDPEWGNADAGAYPTIEISGLTGTGHGEFLYKVSHP